MGLYGFNFAEGKEKIHFNFFSALIFFLSWIDSIWPAGPLRQKHSTLRFKGSFRKCFIAYPVGEVQKEKKPNNYTSNFHSATGALSSFFLVIFNLCFQHWTVPKLWPLWTQQLAANKMNKTSSIAANDICSKKKMSCSSIAFASGMTAKLRKDWWVVVHRTNGLVAPAAFIFASQVLFFFGIVNIHELKRYGIFSSSVEHKVRFILKTLWFWVRIM